MRTLSIRLPDSLLRHARALAARDGISVNQVIALALAEKVFAVIAEDERATRAGEGVDDIHEQFPGIDWQEDTCNGEVTSPGAILGPAGAGSVGPASSGSSGARSNHSTEISQ